MAEVEKTAADEQQQMERPAARRTGPQDAGPARRGPDRRGGRRFFPRRKVCGFCVDHIESIDYKNVDGLKRFLSERGKIEPRRKTGTCARHQRMLAEALRRARHLALLPYTLQHVIDSGIDVGPPRGFRSADRHSAVGPPRAESREARPE